MVKARAENALFFRKIFATVRDWLRLEVRNKLLRNKKISRPGKCRLHVGVAILHWIIVFEEKRSARRRMLVADVFAGVTLDEGGVRIRIARRLPRNPCSGVTHRHVEISGVYSLKTSPSEIHGES